MKRKNLFIVGIISLALIFGFAFSGCSDGGGIDTSILEGTWRWASTPSWDKITFTGTNSAGTFNQESSENGIDIKGGPGTYTVDGVGNLTLDYDDDVGSLYGTYKNNVLIIEGDTYTKTSD